jgi:hypothetical protein
MGCRWPYRIHPEIEKRFQLIMLSFEVKDNAENVTKGHFFLVSRQSLTSLPTL